MSGLLALGVLVAPLAAFFSVARMVEGVEGSNSYFAAVSQIIPLLIIAMAIEVRYLSPRERLVDVLASIYGVCWFGFWYSFVYSLLTFLLVAFSEVIALIELANDSARSRGVMFTAGGLAAASVALVIAVLYPADEM